MIFADFIYIFKDMVMLVLHSISSAFGTIFNMPIFIDPTISLGQIFLALIVLIFVVTLFKSFLAQGGEQ